MGLPTLSFDSIEIWIVGVWILVGYLSAIVLHGISLLELNPVF
jgi:hypothetical protein